MFGPGVADNTHVIMTYNHHVSRVTAFSDYGNRRIVNEQSRGEYAGS
jgi:hypothetical protein